MHYFKGCGHFSLLIIRKIDTGGQKVDKKERDYYGTFTGLREFFLLIVPGSLISKSFLWLFVRNGRIYDFYNKWHVSVSLCPRLFGGDVDRSELASRVR